jgi:hypothetical protein
MDEGMEFGDSGAEEERKLPFNNHENELDDMLLTEEAIMIDEDEEPLRVQSDDESEEEDFGLDRRLDDLILNEIDRDCTAVHLPPADEDDQDYIDTLEPFKSNVPPPKLKMEDFQMGIDDNLKTEIIAEIIRI